jgi:hypothetical protein
MIMFFTKPQVFMVILATSVLLPLCTILGLAMVDSSQLNLFVYISICVVAYMFLYFLYRCNAWEFTFLHLRVIPFIGITLVIIFALYKKGVNYSIHKYDLWIAAISALFILYMGRYIYTIFKAAKKPECVLNMAFPFGDGKYLITDGGDGKSCALMNYHYKSSTHSQHGTEKSMRYATDIVKLRPSSRTITKPVACSGNSDYFIFHETILSPIDGLVVGVTDGIENNSTFPGKGGLPYNVGNHVVIRNDDYYVIMGHMEKGSIMVKEGDYVHMGERIGLVGNAGLTPRPHLHMQVSKCSDGDYWMADGVAITFNNIYPAKNKVITIK